jgi:hypothetical protein
MLLTSLTLATGLLDRRRSISRDAYPALCRPEISSGQVTRVLVGPTALLAVDGQGY